MIAVQSNKKSLTALEDVMPLGVSGYGACAFMVTVTSDFIGTMTFEGSVDGNKFIALTVSTFGGTTTTTATGGGQWLAGCAALTVVRIRLSSYSAGTAYGFVQAIEGGGSGGSGGSGGTVTIANTPIQVIRVGADATAWIATPHVPAISTQATTTKASAGAGIKNVCQSITVTLCSGVTATTVGVPLIVSVIDGASGGGTYLWRSRIQIPAVAGAITTFIKAFPAGLTGTAATAMTVEFSAALTNGYQTVAMEGITST